MNDLDGRIVPDTSTANPPAYNTWQAADRHTLITAILALEEKNKKLQNENAELREKFKTRFARIKGAANPDAMAQMLHKIYIYGASDYHSVERWSDLDSVEDMSKWLQEIGEI